MGFMRQIELGKWYQQLPIPSTATPVERLLTITSDFMVGAGLTMSYEYIRHGELPFAILTGVIGIQSVTGSILFRLLAYERFYNSGI